MPVSNSKNALFWVGLKVRGGQSAFPGQVPHIVSLQDQTRQQPHFCGASVIYPLILLTAAHCFPSPQKLESVQAVGGAHNLNNPTGNEQVRKISRLIIHENWDFGTANNDIAILVLDRPFEFNNFTKPIRIPSPNARLPRKLN